MHSSPMKSALHEGYFVDDLGSEKPTRLEQMRKNSKENIDNLGVANDPAHEKLGKKPRPARRPNERYLSLILFSCFIAIAALLLSLLLIWGKLGKKCECSRTEALSTSVEKLTTDVGKMSSLEEKITSLQRDSIEKGNELKRARLSLDYLQDEHRNLSAKLNITESQLQMRDSDLASLLMGVRYNITAQVDIELSSLRNDLDQSKIQLIASDNETMKSLEAVNASFANEMEESPVSNQSFPLKLGSDTISVYCHVARLGPCGAGGWTLVMKMNGSKDTFHYDSEIWSNKTGFDVSAGMTGLDEKETKLPTYWKTSFTKICLGMKNSEQVNFILINKTADSLHSLIADGKYRNTSNGRDAWKSLLGSNGSLELNCNKEGFNAHTKFSGRPKARIGILGDEQNYCNSSDSRIGFGTGPDSNTCGNVAAWGADNGYRNITAMGYILVQ
ncbi:hypothetical protein AWC38_SpisGene7037 [Stylophora pistillata]|uniref:Fibrinogen C-terminal domain-containing protein n=1 Tax=Stylophora pistillata TaxID=50429 RepID=A0A2B4SEC1_STYPI|nr:hypothetical protein AWC38_SpisGene7037 [Stylophora pistillata]